MRQKRQKNLKKNILQAKMSRKEFLQYSGTALVGIAGVTGAIDSIGKSFGKKGGDDSYGSSAYGGKKRNA
ncbi:MAG TPA: hypothetical protein VGA08_03095 [Candidatus Saccharimonadales bacterium]